jgi:hypothetical protein
MGCVELCLTLCCTSLEFFFSCCRRRNFILSHGIVLEWEAHFSVTGSCMVHRKNKLSDVFA